MRLTRAGVVCGTTDMVPLSQKPKDVVQARPKTLEFQDRIRKEDEEKRLKAEQFERLNVRRVASAHLLTVSIPGR